MPARLRPVQERLEAAKAAAVAWNFVRPHRPMKYRSERRGGCSGAMACSLAGKESLSFDGPTRAVVCPNPSPLILNATWALGTVIPTQQ